MTQHGHSLLGNQSPSPPLLSPLARSTTPRVCSKGMTETWVFREWGRGQGSAAS